MNFSQYNARSKSSNSGGGGKYACHLNAERNRQTQHFTIECRKPAHDALFDENIRKRAHNKYKDDRVMARATISLKSSRNGFDSDAFTDDSSSGALNNRINARAEIPASK